MANYPPLINLDLEEQVRMVNHLRDLILRHQGERNQQMDDLIQMQKEYYARPATEKRDFPFKGAANLIIPLAAITFEAIHARTMTTAFGIEQKTYAKAINPQFDDYVTPIEDMMDYEIKHSKFKERVEPSIMEIEKFGAGAGKIRYETVVKYGVFYEGGVEQEVPVTVRQGCIVDSIPWSKFQYPFDAAFLDDAEWCGEELVKTINEIRIMEDSGLFYKNVSKAVESWFNMNQNRFEVSQQQLENRVPSIAQTLNFGEYWFTFDLKKGRRVECVAHYSLEANILLSLRYNYYKDLHRPHRVGKYMPVEHRIAGIGICKQSQAFQREVTTMHRQRLDNGTIANMRMFVISRMSGIQPNEPIYPGKAWYVDNPEHVQTLQFGDINSSAFNNEHMTLMYHQQYSGINELNLGMPSVGTPGTASDVSIRVQEGNKKFGYTYANIKAYLDTLYNDMLSCIQMFGPRTIQYYSNGPNGQLVQQFLTMPEELIRQGLLIEIGSAGQNNNKVLDRQNWTQVSGIVTQYYTQLMSLAMQLQSPQLVQLVAMKAFPAATEVLKQILESYDIRRPEKILIAQFLNSVGQQASQMLQGGVPLALTQQLPAGQGGSGSVEATSGNGSVASAA